MNSNDIIQADVALPNMKASEVLPRTSMMDLVEQHSEAMQGNKLDPSHPPGMLPLNPDLTEMNIGNCRTSLKMITHYMVWTAVLVR